MSAGLAWLNGLPEQQAKAELLKCCDSRNWAQRMAARRPFQAAQELMETADRIWRELVPEDWLEAFGAHPRIGEDTSAKTGRAETRRWSEQEQSGAAAADSGVLDELARSNREYEARFGYIFIVCATGKSAEEMLALLRRRLQNDPGAELRVAAEEQRKITRLRLEKLLRERVAK